MTGRSALALVLCIVCIAPIAAAQTTPISSGEHADFTRLVFPARDGLGWSMARPTPDRVTLTFDDPALELDSDAVFTRIPRSRLAEIEARGARLTLDLACACDVSVAQIGSGHIVMDIAAAAQARAPAPAPPPRPTRPSLPLRLPPSSDLFFGFAAGSAAPVTGTIPEAEIAGVDPQEDTDPTPRTDSVRAAQISIRTIGRTPLLPGDTVPEPSEVMRLICPEETLAADLFAQDPATAIDRIPALRARLVDEADRPNAGAYRALAAAYLASGLGAEAAYVLRLSPDAPDPVLVGIAAALDGMPDFTEVSAPFDAACGPATAILALLTGVTQDAWRSVDVRTVASFVDTLPKAARDDLVPRLRPALGRLGLPDLLALDPAPVDPPPPPLPLAAGTDRAAITATIAELTGAGGTTSEDSLTNGLALRGSVPDGPLRDELDRALASALVLAGHLTEAVRVIDNRPSLASIVLTEAARTLPAEELAVVAIRLRPALAEGGPGSDLAVETLQHFGLDAIAGGFGTRTVPRVRAPAATDPGDPWLAREFSRLDPETPRGRLAALRQDRNEAAPPPDDFARAASAAEDSARVSEVVLSLIEGSN